MRIVLTRSAARGAELVDRLAAAGHSVSCVPLTTTVDAEAFPDPAPFDGVLFTSVNAVAAAPEGALWPRVGAVGPATAVALAERGIEVGVTGDGGGRALAAAWGPASGQRLLLPQAAGAHPDLADTLRAGGADVACVAVYETLPLAAVDPAPFVDADVVCFFAPSQVKAFADLGVVTNARFWGHGETTRMEIDRLSLPVVENLPV